MYGDKLKNSLIGKTVIGVTATLDDIVFHTDWGDVLWKTEGDCCSQSWIEHFDVPVGRVVEVRSIEMPSSDVEHTAREDAMDRIQDSTQIYGIEIRTDKGTGQIEFRNSSSGYYGGSMELASSPGHEIMSYFPSAQPADLALWGTAQDLTGIVPVVHRLTTHFGTAACPVWIAEIPRDPRDAEVWADAYLSEDSR